MKSERNEAGEWWITHTPTGIEHMGPYDSKREADDDRAGVQRWLDARKEDAAAEKKLAEKKAKRARK